MIITCPRCSASYTVDADLLGASGRTIRCSACGHEWLHVPSPNVDHPRAAESEPTTSQNGTSAIKEDVLRRMLRAAGGDTSTPVAAHQQAAPGLQVAQASPPPIPSDAPSVDGDLEKTSTLAQSEPSLRSAADPVASSMPLSSDAPPTLPEPESARTPNASPGTGMAGTVEAVPQTIAEWRDDEQGPNSAVTADEAKLAYVPPPPAKKRLSWATVAWTACVLGGTAALAGGLYQARMAIVEAIPAAKAVYSALGVSVERLGQNLDIRDIQAKRDSATASNAIVVSGLIANEGAEAQMVPHIRVTLFTTDDRALQHRDLSVAGGPLPAGQSMPFHATIKNPSPAARRIKVTFIERNAHEDATTSQPASSDAGHGDAGHGDAGHGDAAHEQGVRENDATHLSPNGARHGNQDDNAAGSAIKPTGTVSTHNDG